MDSELVCTNEKRLNFSFFYASPDLTDFLQSFFLSLYTYIGFYLQALSKRLGRIINGRLDQENRGVIFTEAFVSRHRARIRGLFSAITR